MEQTRVVIAGAGPVGLFTAYLLARQKIKCIILERRHSISEHPKAHTINPSTLEIFRQAGLDVAYIRRQAANPKDAGHVRLVYGLVDTEIGCFPYERQDDEMRNLTAEPLVNWPQPQLERLLEKAVLETGLAEIRRGWQVDSVDITDTEEAGCIVSCSTSTGRENDISTERHSIQADFIIGADGVNSTVRAKTAGIDFRSMGPGHVYQSIVCKGSLRAALPPGREAMLYFCFHPEHPSEFIAHNLDDSFVHVTPVMGPSSEAPPIEACLPGLQYSEVLRTTWETAPRVASSYSDAKHHVFLVGDAAHSLPPQGGLGLNTGIADAHNLVWKLSSVMYGKGSQDLLASFTRERRPVALANLEYSKASEAAFYSVSTSLVGLAIQFQEAKAQEAPGLDLAMDAFLQRRAVSAAAGEAVKEASRHFDSLALQLGFIYDDPSATKALLDDPTVYVPQACPGARLPHGNTREGLSLLDLVPYDRFTVLHCANPAFASCDWAVDVSGLGLPESWYGVVREIKGGKGIVVRPDHRVLVHVDSPGQADAAIKEYLNHGKV
ncbi:FAD binding domain-containing protein [Colletotrichum tamarilloi]|uniref:FAD binding domain-containing protein n=1 Tax=Colletotrichum tamarilloi TaxID=1209934 RepID=A0ABQ9R2M7_9PEZI|nr:FAD binding domain-containing protein [Colletotrichum tamarilloi]KAK1492656.1 FAD binding domain-containing protein [Colletotrichum tamarilloi]